MSNSSMEKSLIAKALQARRAAKRAGLIVRKSRWRRGTIDNYGEFQIIDPFTNRILAGERFNMSPEDVVAFCKSQ